MAGQVQELTLDRDAVESDPRDLVDWQNPPSLKNLREDFESAKPAHQSHVLEVDNWLNIRNGVQALNVKPGRSRLVPKLARKQAEWRYSALCEPFLSTDDLFNTAPVTFEDKQTAEQNGLVLNYQINCKIDKVKFIDDYVRTAVDEGTVIVRVGWDFQQTTRTVEEPVYQTQIVMGPDGQPVQKKVQTGTRKVTKKVTTKNEPVLTICDYRNLVIDPTCEGNLEKAGFVIYSFETSYNELKKDGRYKNLDNINFESASVLAEPDHNIEDKGNFTFKDKARKRVVAREYWGFWDIHGTGETVAIVAVWVGNTLIRLEENPYPDKKIPFVLVQYLPRRRNVYGEPDAELLSDNQRIIGAVTRGIIDVIGRSANGQQGIRKDALDVTNARKFERGEDYKFNANVDPTQAFRMETYPEIPRSALEVLQMQNNEAEALTGVKAFTNGISGQALGNTATGIRSALDATSKRELGILRRLSNGITEIGRKIISMNAEFLDDKEIIRITNEQFVEINREDLGGKYDIKLGISTAEADEQKASELAFMLQTVGNNLPLEMSQIILADIAKLRKMPELAKRIQEFKPQPDPMVQQEQMLRIALLEAQVANERAKAAENEVDSQLKQAKTANELAKARDTNSGADLKDLEFVEKDSGVAHAREQEAAAAEHTRTMAEKEHDRLAELDKQAFGVLTKSNSNS